MSMPKKEETELRQKASYVKALNYIWLNIEKNLSLDELSNVCGVSKFHLHRIFKYFQSENLSAYINRKRLEYSANYLVMFPYSNISILSAELGFSSAANFSKAFKKYFGITPKEWKGNNVEFKNIECLLTKKYEFNLDYSCRYSKHSYLTKPDRKIESKNLTM